MASNQNNPTDNLTSKSDFIFTSILQTVLSELSSPTNLILTLISIYLIYKIFFQSSETSMYFEQQQKTKRFRSIVYNWWLMINLSQ